MYQSRFNKLYNEIILQMTKLTTNANKKLLSYSKIKNQYTKLLQQYNNLIKKSEEAEQKITELHPQLAAKLQKIKENPKNAWQAGQRLHICLSDGQVNPKYTDIYTGSMYNNDETNYVAKFGNNLHQAFELNKQVSRLKIQMETLEHQLGDLVNSIQNTDTFKENLPPEFINVLNQLKQYIINIYQKQKEKKKVIAAKTFAAAPLHNTVKKLYDIYQKNKNNLFALSSITNHEYYLKYIMANNFQQNLVLPETQEELLQQIINANINNKSDIHQKEYLSNYIKTQYSYLVNNAQANVRSCENINAVNHGTAIFKQLEAQFLDKLSEYCTKIISAEDVHLGIDGTINGIVHAENGSFYVRTIEAGGYNIQKLHFRVIITPIKTK